MEAVVAGINRGVGVFQSQEGHVECDWNAVVG